MPGGAESRFLRVELEDDVHSLAFDDTGSLLAVGVEDKGVYIIAAGQARVVDRLEFSGFTPYSLAWGSGFIAAGEGRIVLLCKYPGFQCCGTPIPTLLPPSSLALTPDRLLAIGLTDGQLLIYSIREWGVTPEASLKLGDSDIYDVDYNGRRFAATDDKRLYIIARRDGSWVVEKKVRIGETGFHVKWIDDKRVLVESSELLIIDVESGERKEVEAGVLRGAKAGPYFVGIGLNGLEVYLVVPDGVARVAQAEVEVEGLVEKMAAGIHEDELRVAYVDSKREDTVNILVLKGVVSTVKP